MVKYAKIKEPPCTRRYARWCERSGFLTRNPSYLMTDFTKKWAPLHKCKYIFHKHPCNPCDRIGYGKPCGNLPINKKGRYDVFLLTTSYKINMSKLNVDQKTVMELFANAKADFLIPDYQRPYAWGKEECQTLWTDIFTFSFPDDNYENFDEDNGEYFLGPIVTFKNKEKQQEIIDGQQRLTTLMLLLRAFYSKCVNMQDSNSKKTSKFLEKCLWKTDLFGEPDKSKLKINSEVATDEEREDFLRILITGEAINAKSRYAKNYRFFQEKIQTFVEQYPTYFPYMPMRILSNCILLPIEAESQDTALRIFSTLNDRGMPLSDADIFKAQFYKFYKQAGHKDEFITKWKYLEGVCNEIFHPISGTPMDEIFTRYMYYERAKKQIKSSTTEALRKFYERDSYQLLHNARTLENLIELAMFWYDVENQDEDRFSETVLKKLLILRYAPNSMWTYILSVYFMANRNANGMLDDKLLCEFLNKVIAIVWAYAVYNPGVNALRTPLFSAMVNIVNHENINLDDFKIDSNRLNNILNNYNFSNRRGITKAMLIWWAYQLQGQGLWLQENVLEIEHIYPKKRQEIEHSLKDPNSIDSLGNKAILEKKINIRASDYRFEDKIKYYIGYETAKNQHKEGTRNVELIEMAKMQNTFTEKDIQARHDRIIENFIKYVGENGLINYKMQSI